MIVVGLQEQGLNEMDEESMEAQASSAAPMATAGTFNKPKQPPGAGRFNDADFNPYEPSSDEQRREEERKRKEANQRLKAVMDNLKADMQGDSEADDLLSKFNAKKAQEPMPLASSRAEKPSDADFSAEDLPQDMFASTPAPSSRLGMASPAPAAPVAALPPLNQLVEGNRGYQNQSEVADWRKEGFRGALDKLRKGKKPGGSSDIPMSDRPPSGRARPSSSGMSNMTATDRF